MADRTAVEYARAAASWGPVDWWKLETSAFHDAGEVRSALALVSPREAWRDLSKRRGLPRVFLPLGCLWILLIFASFTVLPWFMMILPFTALSEDGDPAALAIGGVCAALAAAVAGYGLLRHEPGGDQSIGRMFGWFHVIPAVIGTLAAIVVVALGETDQPIWIIAYFVELVVAILHFVVYRDPPSTSLSNWRALFRRLDDAVADLEPDQRARISADIAQALTVLGASGLVDDDDLARARQASLGNLGVTMAPRGALPEQTPSGRGPTPREVKIKRRYDESLEAYRQVVGERTGRRSPS